MRGGPIRLQPAAVVYEDYRATRTLAVAAGGSVSYRGARIQLWFQLVRGRAAGLAAEMAPLTCRCVC